MFSMIVLTESGLDHIKKHQLLGSQPCAQKRAGCFFWIPQTFFIKPKLIYIYICILKSRSLLSYTLEPIVTGPGPRYKAGKYTPLDNFLNPYWLGLAEAGNLLSSAGAVSKSMINHSDF